MEDQEAPPSTRRLYRFSPVEGWLVWCPDLEVWHLALAIPPACELPELTAQDSKNDPDKSVPVRS